MLADAAAAGAGILFVVFFIALFVVSIGGVVLWIMSLIEIARTPDHQFRAAGTEKVTWILVVALIGWIGALIWRLAKRRDVLAFAGMPAPAMMAPPMMAPAPGWYPDPSGQHRWWDGVRWSDAPGPGGASSGYPSAR